LVAVIGWDIGGANTKAVFLRVKDGCVEELTAEVEYFPVWKAPDRLVGVLSALKGKVSGNVQVDGVGLTMTAELSDAYQTKREGVNSILTCAEKAFAGLPIFVLDVDARLRSVNYARGEPLGVAAANWAATGWLVAQMVKTCVMVDVGSTSTSIIPMVEGRVAAAGKTDLEKLMAGELVYTGSLRTNVAAIMGSIPLRGGVARVASELFAQSGDVHLVLGNITEEEYTTETADGRGKTREEALARLARVVCADTEMLSEEEIVQIAQHVRGRQVEQVAEGLKQVYSRVMSLTSEEVPVVVTGIGKTFLAEAAARKIGVSEVLDLEKLCLGDAFVYRMPESPWLCGGVVKASPAFGVALMAARKLEGANV
jgi:(4-(4-[2-(gamma-L-glutamylamino)ethyl]phenoxymethyl)furan-2-yl)methanamine synthase